MTSLKLHSKKLLMMLYVKSKSKIKIKSSLSSVSQAEVRVEDAPTANEKHSCPTQTVQSHQPSRRVKHGAGSKSGKSVQSESDLRWKEMSLKSIFKRREWGSSVKSKRKIIPNCGSSKGEWAPASSRINLGHCKELLVTWPEVARRIVTSQKFNEIGRLILMKDFKGKASNFEGDVLLNR